MITGSLREWRPVVVRAPLMDDATRDTPIYIDVKMPPDAKRGHHRLSKDIHRRDRNEIRAAMERLSRSVRIFGTNTVQ